MRNLITDVPGVLVGNAQDVRAATGATVAVFDGGAVAGVATLGGAPGSRGVTILEPEMLDGRIDAVVLSGGSLFGLDAAGGATSVLVADGRGGTFGGITLPSAVQAILFDLTNGGEKDWLKAPMEHRPPYWDLGRDAARAAADTFELGTAGAGYGATTANLKGGLGSASARTRQGFTVGALVAVNAVGMATIGDGPHFWAGAYEQGNEFGGLGWPAKVPPSALAPRFKGCRHQPPRPPSRWSPPTPRSRAASASGWRSWPTMAWAARCARRTPPTTATRCSPPPPAAPVRPLNCRC